MDIIVDLIDQLIEARIKRAGGQSWHMSADDFEIAKLKERLRRVLAENIPNK